MVSLAPYSLCTTANNKLAIRNGSRVSPFTSFLLKKTDDGPSFKTNRGLATWPKVNLEGKFYFFPTSHLSLFTPGQ